eukprot:m.40819 g.40819  ORF g.40819 m.40819 type:complete len:89 (+) comp18624_c0_seq1:1321-1587(+)
MTRLSGPTCMTRHHSAACQRNPVRPGQCTDETINIVKLCWIAPTQVSVSVTSPLTTAKLQHDSMFLCVHCFGRQRYEEKEEYEQEESM